MKSFACFLMMISVFLSQPTLGQDVVAPGTPVREEIQTGGSTASARVGTSKSLRGIDGHLYLAAISTKPNVAVTSVSGLGLTWTLVRAQCSGRAQTRVEVWQAQGHPTGNSLVKAKLARAPKNAVIVVSRYSSTSGIGNLASANTIGEDGQCSGGKDSDSYSVNLTTMFANSIAYGAVALRNKKHTPGAGYTGQPEVDRGSEGDVAGIAIEEKRVPSASAVVVDGQFSRDVDWAVVAVEIKPSGGPPDLDVAYIERTPRYFRYALDHTYQPGDPWGIPRLCAGTEKDKRWPDEGEDVTYTAHVLNKGTGASPGFGFMWIVDGTLVEQGEFGSLGPGEVATISHQRPWPAEPETIEFRVIPGGAIPDAFASNNQLTIGSHDLTLSIWVEQGLHEIFDRTLNLAGTRSFEDWIQAQFAKMNERFAQAIYPVATEGIFERVRIDKIVVAPEVDGLFHYPGPCVPELADPDKFFIDGRWFFTDGDETNARGLAGGWQDYVNQFATTIDWGLIHELAHQVGVIDLYRMNLANEPETNNRFLVQDLQGQVIPAAKLPTYAWDQILFEFPGIMAGGDTRPYMDGTYFESHTAGGMNSHYNYRRGYFGEYLFDTPAITYLRVINADGQPLSGVEVQFYQKDAMTEYFYNEPVIVGGTVETGRMILPNRPIIMPIETATGHTLRENPFGQIFHEGTNGTMFVKVIKGDQELYGWLFVLDLNLAYWAGHQDEAEITVVVVPPKP